MRNKLIYIFIVVILSVGFFALGWYMHKSILVTTDTVQDEIVYGPDFSHDQPYRPFLYDVCPMNNIPDEQSCITEYFYSTIEEADVLANKLMQTSPEKNAIKFEGYYDSLHSTIKSVQQLRDQYINAYCALDGMKIYGGTGEIREIMACQYYHAKQYLELLKELERDVSL